MVQKYGFFDQFTISVFEKHILFKLYTNYIDLIFNS